MKQKKIFETIAFLSILLASCGESNNNEQSQNTVVECQETQVRCSADGIPQLCTSGAWKDQQPCQQNYSCNEGQCKPNDASSNNDQDTSQSLCNPDSCKTAAPYAGNQCVTRNNTQSCGCNSNVDCNSGYICDSNTQTCKLKTTVPDDPAAEKCSPTACAAKTMGYQGNVCVSETEEGVTYTDCGCKENGDCKAGYSCDLDLSICIEDCTPAKCKTMTDKYSGNICITFTDEWNEGYTYCGCNSNSDCNSGYSCNSEFKFCQLTGSDNASCKPESCASRADAEYVGNACIIVSGGVDCGCDSDDDCRDPYICNAMGQCIIDQDISECKTNADCAPQSGKEYYGNICLTDQYDNTIYTYCGCEKNADCLKGYYCDVQNAQCFEDEDGDDDDSLTCVPADCAAKVAYYYGNACVDYYGYTVCGCLKQSDCRAGYTCDTSQKACEPN